MVDSKRQKNHFNESLKIVFKRRKNDEMGRWKISVDRWWIEIFSLWTRIYSHDNIKLKDEYALCCPHTNAAVEVDYRSSEKSQLSVKTLTA